MFYIFALIALITLLTLSAAQLSNLTTPTLNLTTIASRSNASIIQCWSFPSFTGSTTAGISGALSLYLGEMANASYTIIPSRFNGGAHNAPAAQLVIFVSGLAHVTIPNTTLSPTTEAWVQGGKYGTIVAVDTADKSAHGHVTTYPGDADTVGIVVPFRDGKVPVHEVLYDGPCLWSEMIGL